MNAVADIKTIETKTVTPQDIDKLLERGLYDLWYPICPSDFVKERPVSMRRLGYKIALWRDDAGVIHALEDHCPHRGAPLSMGVNLGDRLACPYHGIEVRCDGLVTKVLPAPGAHWKAHARRARFMCRMRMVRSGCTTVASMSTYRPSWTCRKS